MDRDAAYPLHLIDDEDGFSEEELADVAPRCTDSANADAFVRRHGNGFRYVIEWGKWLAWDGKKWHDTGAQGRVIHAAMLSAREDYALAKPQIAALEEEQRIARLKNATDDVEKLEHKLKGLRALLKWHEQSQNAARLNACVSLLATRLTLTVRDLDSHPWLLNAINGTVDLRTSELRAHSREDYLTQLTPIEFDEDATCPVWLRFLDQMMAGDTHLVLYLQRIVGYTLTGLTSEQALFFHYGATGSNGKSTFINTVKLVLGEYACSAPRDLLMVQKTPKHETEIARLHGKRLASGAEVGDGQRFDEAKVKDLTGSDIIPARRMNEDFWDLKPTHKLMLAGNYKPTIVGSDPAIWRRIQLVPWLVQVSAEQKDRALPDKLHAELSGILKWAVMGCLEWQRVGLSEPAAVLEATKAYRLESDVLGSFLDATCTFEREATISKATLRERYERWCKDGGHEPVGGRRLAARLRERGAVEVTVREAGVVRHGWRGVRFQTEAEQFTKTQPVSDEKLS